MEIYSIRSSHNLLYKNNTKNQKTAEMPIEATSTSIPSFQLSEQESGNLDFTSISARELREFARLNFDNGKIDQETFSAISEELPMHAIDASGRIIDLSSVTDGTSFDFLDYYQNQLKIAQSLGDARNAETLSSVVAFLQNPQL